MIHLEPATEDQLPTLLQLDAEASPWPWPDTALNRHLVLNQVMCAFEGHALLGFLVAQSVLDETSLLHLVVSQAHQRQGVGASMMRLWLSQLADQGQQECLLEVRESNLPARALYHRLGFTEIGRRTGYYPVDSGFESAIVMAISLAEADSRQY